MGTVKTIPVTVQPPQQPDDSGMVRDQVTSDDRYIAHIVQNGETPESIAAAYHVSLSTLLRENTELTALPWVDRRVRRWEPEPLRWLGVHAMYALYRAADARESATSSPRTSALARLADAITGH